MEEFVFIKESMTDNNLFIDRWSYRHTFQRQLVLDLNEVFNNRYMGNGGSASQAHRLPDLSAFNFSLWDQRETTMPTKQHSKIQML
jgi:hypothetical protein